jgi:hypothetical protein
MFSSNRYERLKIIEWKATRESTTRLSKITTLNEINDKVENYFDRILHVEWMKWIQLFVIQSIVIGLCCQSASTVVDLSRILISAILWCLWNKLWKVPWTSEHNWKTITSTIRTSPIVIKEMHRMQVNDLWTTDDDWLVDVSLEREIVFYLFLTVD